jgi:hypothetical protein
MQLVVNQRSGCPRDALGSNRILLYFNSHGGVGEQVIDLSM